jgi:bacitracin transport system ATP-binding protein
MSAILEAHAICKHYGNKFNRNEVLRGIDLTIEQGEFVAIMGASGSGKTTLLNVLSTIDRVSVGTIKIDGQAVNGMKDKVLADFRKQKLGFIFQDFNLLDTLTVKENILLPLSVRKIPRAEANQRFHLIAKELGIEEIRNSYPAQISGGQKQRTAAARAIIHQPALVFADEPTGSLDSRSAADLLSKLESLNRVMRSTIVMVTHDAAAASYSSRVIFIRDGMIYHQLYRGEQDRTHYFKDIMRVQSVVAAGGGLADEVQPTADVASSTVDGQAATVHVQARKGEVG